MKKVVNLFTVSLLSTFLFTGCDSNDAENPENGAVEDNQSDETIDTNENDENAIVSIVIQENGEAIEGWEQEVEVEEGMTLLEVMHENYDVEDDGGFITSIEELSQDEEEGNWWLFDINGEMAPAGAGDTHLEDGDEVVWNLGGMD
ncbi:DUF4430 domain-containing protein [Alkalibacterium psychrotolerans]|uniref:DUF4430 domain-containing protein n=1 Tax=Alkalibacterium indicireducens TaxID=398758 RepID=A0ABN1B578_9LACT